MILRKLYELYLRQVEDGSLPAPHLADTKVHLAVVIDSEGGLLGIDTLFTEEGKALRPREVMAPLPPKGRSGIAPPAQLLYDRVDYVLGVVKKVAKGDPAARPTPDAREVAKARDAQRRFLKALQDLPEAVRADEGVRAAILFAERLAGCDDAEAFLGEHIQHAGLDKLRGMDQGTVTFRLDGDKDADGNPRLVFERPAVRQHCLEIFSADASDALPPEVCLITGKRAPIARLHTKISGISDVSNKRSAAALVSFNEDAFESWGREGGANASISVEAERGYSAALSALLSGRHGLRPIGGVSYVAWGDGVTADAIDESLVALFGAQEQGVDAPDPRTIVAALRSPLTGRAVEGDGHTYNILGLQAAMGRAVVRMWRTDTVEGISSRLAQHFEDFGAEEKRALPIRKMIEAIALKADESKVPPAVSAGIFRAALDGTAYPRQLLWGATDRLIRSRPGKDKDEVFLNANRVRCITACIRRAHRLGQTSTGVPMSLDVNNPDVAYRLGRLFSIYESIQRVSDPNLNVTLRDALFGSASRTPSRVFPMLASRTVSHMGRLRKQRNGLGIHFGKQLDEVMGGMPVTGFPERLTPDGVGRFVVGYHHQKAFRRSGEDSAEIENESGVPAAAEQE